MTKLNRSDWEKLDTLLGKHGFGGYYDLVEMLRICAIDLGIGNTGLDLEDVSSLPEIVKLLKDWTLKLSIADGFDAFVLQLTSKEASQ